MQEFSIFLENYREMLENNVKLARLLRWGMSPQLRRSGGKRQLPGKPRSPRARDGAGGSAAPTNLGVERGPEAGRGRPRGETDGLSSFRTDFRGARRPARRAQAPPRACARAARPSGIGVVVIGSGEWGVGSGYWALGWERSGSLGPGRTFGLRGGGAPSSLAPGP